MSNNRPARRSTDKTYWVFKVGGARLAGHLTSRVSFPGERVDASVVHNVVAPEGSGC
jgi:hypothetical protein